MSVARGVFEELSRDDEETRVVARLRAPTGTHAIFDGHFPGDPLVPAYVVLALIEELSRELVGAPIDALAGVRFRAPVRPGGELLVVVDRDRRGGRFQVEVDGERSASGCFSSVGALERG